MLIKEAFTLRLPPELKAFVDATSKAEGRSANNLLNQWVREKFVATQSKGVTLRAKPELRSQR